MKQLKETRGGLRNPPGGRPPKAEKRVTVQICISPANAAYLAAMGRAKSDFINLLLDGERKAAS